MLQAIFSSSKNEVESALQNVEYTIVKSESFHAFGHVVHMTMIWMDDTKVNRQLCEKWEGEVKLVRWEEL